MEVDLKNVISDMANSKQIEIAKKKKEGLGSLKKKYPIATHR
jgi:hypothetical protein